MTSKTSGLGDGGIEQRAATYSARGNDFPTFLTNRTIPRGTVVEGAEEQAKRRTSL